MADATPDRGADTVDDVGRAKLHATIAAFPSAPFAVVDGGLFEDLPRLFRRERLFARSLYLDQVDPEVQKAGPWLFALNQSPEATAFVLSLPTTMPFGVFWSCRAGEAVLHRHLRTLSMARIPVWAADSLPAPPDPTQADVLTTVFFRHFDPRVLGALMPALDAAQFSRILGPAEEIAFDSPDYGGLKRVIADPAWPRAPQGLLTVRSEQCLGLIDRRVSASHRRLVAYLRRHAPMQTASLRDDELLEHVRGYEQEAFGFGVRNESSIARWCYMQVDTTRDLSREPITYRHLADPANGATPDERMDHLMRFRTRLLRMERG